MNLLTLFAQGAAAGAIGSYVIVAIVILAVLGIGFVFLKQSNVPVPAGGVQILWIVIAAFLAIVAIKFLLSAV